jgi:23S rRNA pseudouridine2605 synthase
MKERLQKILSAHGVSSRRAAEALIAEGRVTVNGIPATLGQSADTASDVIAVDGNALTKKPEYIYIMLHKPRGYVTTLRDEKGRRNVAELTADCGVRVWPVGRLDIDSEGLLIMTNDGELTHRLAHPSGGKTKTYRVAVRGDAAAAVKPLSEPMIIDGYKIMPAKVSLIRQTAEGGTLDITISEGRNRQIRKMCAQSGLEVVTLRRIAEGGLSLGQLKTGQWRYLTSAEIDLLKGISARNQF